MLGVVQTIGAAIVDLVARAEHHVHGFGLGALREGEQLAVEAQSQYEPGLLAAGQLGVDDFVAPGAETGGALHAAQEVGMADQILVQQRRLIDDRRALPHGGEGLRRQRFGVVLLALDLHDLAVRFLQLAEVAHLEVMALALDQLRVVVVVTPQLAKLRVFAGGQQKNVSIEMAQALEPFGGDAEYVRIEGHGKNALAFHTAYCVGRLAEECPGAFFHIISTDTGIDALIRHLKSKKIFCLRWASIEAIPLVRLLHSRSLPYRVNAVVESLSRRAGR